jgi:hypothetical protein
LNYVELIETVGKVKYQTGCEIEKICRREDFREEVRTELR